MGQTWWIEFPDLIVWNDLLIEVPIESLIFNTSPTNEFSIWIPSPQNNIYPVLI